MKPITNIFSLAASLRSQLRLFMWFLAFACFGLAGHWPQVAAAPVRVVVWDEQQPAQKEVYTNFLGNQIAGYLGSERGFTVVSRRLDDPQQGLSAETLDACDVLIWWGHIRHAEIKPETAKEIVRRIQSGKLSLIALHSAHWSAPFMEAMNVRAHADALKPLSPEEQKTVIWHETNQFSAVRVPPRTADRLTPFPLYYKPIGGPVEITLATPNCCFPSFRADAKPSELHVLLPKHPIAKGLPPVFTIPKTEMYGEPFHVPPPDEVVLEERWGTGEWFRSGSVWNVGKGKVFYFRPGHEIYPVFTDPVVLKVIENAARWLGKGR